MVSLRSGVLALVLAACSAERPPRVQGPDAPLAIGGATRAPAAETTIACVEPALAPAPAREAAIDLFLADHPVEAYAALAKVLARDPRDRAAEVFLSAAKKKLASARAEAGDVFRGARRVKLAPIALTAGVVHPLAERGPKVTLEKISEARNLITDATDWETRTGTTSTKQREPGAIPPILGRERLSSSFVHPDHVVAIYERTIVVTAEGKTPVAFDVSDALTSGPRPFEIGFAQLVGGSLVVQLAYNGYAKAAGGKNGYFAAFDGATGALAWTSPPLVANGDETVVSGGSIITGYGFTAEPDFLFVLDLATGSIDQKIPVRSGPELVRAKGDQLFVRTYDTDYVFRARTGFARAVPVTLAAAEGRAAPAASVEARCRVREATAAILAKNASALAEAVARLRPVSHDRVLDDVLRAETTTLAAPGVLDLPAAPLVVVPPPPWRETRATAPLADATRPPRLVKTHQAAASPVRAMRPVYTPNAPFFLAPVEHGALPPGARPDIPSSYGMQDLSGIIPDDRAREPGPPPKDARSLLVYGGRYVAIVDDARGVERVFDLDAFEHPPAPDRVWKEFATEEATYAQVRGDVLYVCNGGGSYAKEVSGRKGFLSALDRTTGALLWRSAPLTCNATFAVAGDYLVTGYGFTAEPDFVFLVRRADGAIVQKLALPSGPETITRDGARIHVETYDAAVDLELQP